MLVKMHGVLGKGLSSKNKANKKFHFSAAKILYNNLMKEIKIIHMGHNFSSDTTPKNEVVRSGLKFG